MKVESLDFYYLSMPEVLDIGDGSQDALLVRLQAGEYVGWGECEASPLVSIASLVCPMSHSACKPVRKSVLGQRLDTIDDILRIGDLVRENSADLLQADHTLSGIEIAMWDLMGKRYDLPIYRLLGYEAAYPKTPYASQLFGDTPQETLHKAQQVSESGYTAAKFGWGTFGRGTVQADIEQVVAAREGLGPDAVLLIDAGTVWKEDVEAAALRVKVLQECGVVWLEEPFVSGALDSYRELASLSGDVKLAAGEGCHNYHMAKQMIDRGALGFIQIDTGRVGGISVAKQVASYAHSKKVTYVNHTFTSHLALSASLQPYAGLEEDYICEYPTELKPLALELTKAHIIPNQNGQISVPEAPGLGITPDLQAAAKYLVDVHIEVQGKTLYRTPPMEAQ